MYLLQILLHSGLYQQSSDSVLLKSTYVAKIASVEMSTDFREFKWKTLAQNYEDFQNELDNAANGIDFLKDLFLEFQKFEVRSTKDKLHRFDRVRTVSLNFISVRFK